MKNQNQKQDTGLSGRKIVISRGTSFEGTLRTRDPVIILGEFRGIIEVRCEDTDIENRLVECPAPLLEHMF